MKAERCALVGFVWVMSGCSLALDWDRSQLAQGGDAATDQEPIDAVSFDAVPAVDVSAADVLPADVAVDRATVDRPDVCTAAVDHDPQNCGACGVRCAFDETCTGGRCTAVCHAPLTTCGSQCVDLLTTAEHCGSCGVSCSSSERRCCRGFCLTRCL